MTTMVPKIIYRYEFTCKLTQESLGWDSVHAQDKL